MTLVMAFVQHKGWRYHRLRSISPALVPGPADLDA